MIHDAVVEVPCDGAHCLSSISIKANYTYRSYSEKSGSYDTSDEAIERQLRKQEDWIVSNGKHYCSGGCASEGESNG